MFTELSCKHALFLLTMCSAVPQALSDGTEVAGIDRYFLTTLDSIGYRKLFAFHHCNGLSVTSGSDKYNQTSVDDFC